MEGEKEGPQAQGTDRGASEAKSPWPGNRVIR